MPATLGQNADEIIVLDDESSDGTGALARSLLGPYSRARVWTGAPAPSGWAARTGPPAAGGRSVWIAAVYCDADVLLAEGAVDAVIMRCGPARRRLLGVSPADHGHPRRAPHHAAHRRRAAVLSPFSLLSVDVPQAATANGLPPVSTWPVDDQLGGFAAGRTNHRDVAIARRARKTGLKLGLVLGGQLVATRMYGGYRTVVTGTSRGLLPVTGGSRSRLVLGAGGTCWRTRFPGAWRYVGAGGSFRWFWAWPSGPSSRSRPNGGPYGRRC